MVYRATALLLMMASVAFGKLALSNDAIAASWEVVDGHLRQVNLIDKFANRTLTAPEDVFEVIVAEAGPIRSSRMRLVTDPRVEGKSIEATLRDDNSQLSVTWRAILPDGANYLRQEITLTAEGGDVPIASVRLIDWELPDARVAGSVKGSPIVSGDMFFAFEHPLSESRVSRGRAIASLARELPLKRGQTVTYSSVIGVTHAGQLRRGFLNYLERERAHPYRT